MGILCCQSCGQKLLARYVVDNEICPFCKMPAGAKATPPPTAGAELAIANDEKKNWRQRFDDLEIRHEKVVNASIVVIDLITKEKNELQAELSRLKGEIDARHMWQDLLELQFDQSEDEETGEYRPLPPSEKLKQ